MTILAINYMTNVSKWYRKATYILVIATFLLMLMGGYVKAIGAGLACPDWPLCYGKLFPFLDGNVYEYDSWLIFAEWFHRLWAALVGILLLGVVYMSSSYQEEIPTLFRLSLILVILFGTQVLFGALTVLKNLDPIIVVFHLGNAILIIILEMIIAFIATVKSENFNF